MGNRRLALKDKHFFERIDGVIGRRIPERQVLEGAIWFVNVPPPFDVRTVCKRLAVLPPLSKGGVLKMGSRWKIVMDLEGEPSTRSVQYSHRLQQWLAKWFADQVDARQRKRPEIRKKRNFGARKRNRARLSFDDVLRMGADVFARVGFDGKRWVIVEEQPLMTPTLEGFVHYAATLVSNPKLEWRKWLLRCVHVKADGSACGVFFLKGAVRGSNPERCQKHQIDRKNEMQGLRNQRRKEAAAT